MLKNNSILLVDKTLDIFIKNKQPSFVELAL
jgi:hypothetical protein